MNAKIHCKNDSSQFAFKVSSPIDRMACYVMTQSGALAHNFVVTEFPLPPRASSAPHYVLLSSLVSNFMVSAGPRTSAILWGSAWVSFFGCQVRRQDVWTRANADWVANARRSTLSVQQNDEKAFLNYFTPFFVSLTLPALWVCRIKFSVMYNSFHVAFDLKHTSEMHSTFKKWRRNFWRCDGRRCCQSPSDYDLLIDDHNRNSIKSHVIFFCGNFVSDSSGVAWLANVLCVPT